MAVCYLFICAALNPACNLTKEIQDSTVWIFTWAVTLAGLVWSSSEGGGMLQSFGLVLKDRRGQFLQGTAQQVGSLLGPFMMGELPTSSYRESKKDDRYRRKKRVEDEWGKKGTALRFIKHIYNFCSGSECYCFCLSCSLHGLKTHCKSTKTVSTIDYPITHKGMCYGTLMRLHHLKMALDKQKKERAHDAHTDDHDWHICDLCAIIQYKICH